MCRNSSVKQARTLPTSLGPAVCAALIIGVSQPAQALQFSVSGNVLHVIGSIKSGDDIAFRAFYQPLRGTIRIVDLNSGGGLIAAAKAIGDIIRADGLATEVDARRSICASACTLLFISGQTRHYLNAGAIADGVGPKRGHGLGFHEGNDSLSPGANHYSGKASGAMIAGYYAYGVGAAADLLTKSPPESLFYVSPATALSMRIATSLTAP